LEKYNKKERFVCANIEKITKDIPEEHRFHVQKLILALVNSKADAFWNCM